MQTEVRYGKYGGFQHKIDVASRQAWLLEFSIFENGCGLGELKGALSRQVESWKPPDCLKLCGPWRAAGPRALEASLRASLCCGPEAAGNASGLWAFASFPVRGKRVNKENPSSISASRN